MEASEDDARTDVAASEVQEGSSLCANAVYHLFQLKWLVLFVSCFVNLGLAYIMDFPGSLGCGSTYSIEAFFHASGKVYNQRMNQALYSVYSWPNTALAVGGGLLIDKYIGLRRALVLFASLVFAGSVLFALGIKMLSFPMMMLGRLVFGLGGESLSVAQSTLLSRWFTRGNGMSFAFGINISFSRVFASMNFLLSPYFSENYGITAAAGAGAVLCGVSVSAAAILCVLDCYGVSTGVVEPEEGEENEAGSSEGTSSGTNFSDVFLFTERFWLLCGICVFSYNSVAPFVGIAKIFFELKYSFSATVASQYISSYQLTGAILSPIVGLLVDRLGRNTYILLLVSISFGFIHFMFMVSSISPIYLMILVGFGVSFLASSLWPAVPLVVAKEKVALSFGIMTSLQNVGLAIFPMIVGWILDMDTEKGDSDKKHPSDDLSSFFGKIKHTFGFASEIGNLPSMEKFQMTLALFAFSALVSTLFSAVLLYRDRQGDGILSASKARREALSFPGEGDFSSEEEEHLLDSALNSDGTQE